MAELHDETGRFAPGNPGGPGRPKGPSQRTKRGMDLARQFLEDKKRFDLYKFWGELLNGDDKRLAFDTMKFLFEHGFGRPPVNDDTSMFEDGGELPDVFEAWEAPAAGAESTSQDQNGGDKTP